MTGQTVRAPLYVDHGRPFIDATVVGPSGRSEASRFLFDTGGGGLILSEQLAQAIGIRLTGEHVVEEWGTRLERVPLPLLIIAGQSIDLDLQGEAVVMLGDSSHPLNHNVIPGRALAYYRVLIDYPGRKFALLPSEASQTRGTPVRTPVHPETRFPRVEIEVAGQRFGVLLDTGLVTGCTVMSPSLFSELADAHPEWIIEPVRWIETGIPDLDEGVRMMRIPHVKIGPFDVPDVSIVTRAKGGRFEEFSALAMTGNARGALGGNVLARFRLEIDYLHGITYFEPASTGYPCSPSLDPGQS